ncbi:hypothetical protein LTR37_003402 [Vermiconidia calcicola]|uniref:Uncharacterized protein n=1 Tax=Vermiconidia calcicola TaxID=1690605 RepID=A0ACC3NQ61_9PEZI|nr:hypothetical protein LTR37_003402 [Vermiconidia calcicola]
MADQDGHYESEAEYYLDFHEQNNRQLTTGVPGIQPHEKYLANSNYDDSFGFGHASATHISETQSARQPASATDAFMYPVDPQSLYDAIAPAAPASISHEDHGTHSNSSDQPTPYVPLLPTATSQPGPAPTQAPAGNQHKYPLQSQPPWGQFPDLDEVRQLPPSDYGFNGQGMPGSREHAPTSSHFGNILGFGQLQGTRITKIDQNNPLDLVGNGDYNQHFGHTPGLVQNLDTASSTFHSKINSWQTLATDDTHTEDARGHGCYPSSAYGEQSDFREKAATQLGSLGSSEGLDQSMRASEEVDRDAPHGGNSELQDEGDNNQSLESAKLPSDDDADSNEEPVTPIVTSFDAARARIDKPDAKHIKLVIENDDVEEVDREKEYYATRIYKGLRKKPTEAPDKFVLDTDKTAWLEHQKLAWKECKGLMTNDEEKKDAFAWCVLFVGIVVKIHRDGIAAHKLSSDQGDGNKKKQRLELKVKQWIVDLKLTCSQRMEKAVGFIEQNKYVASDIISGLGMLAFACHPTRYNSQKCSNFKLNKKRSVEKAQKQGTKGASKVATAEQSLAEKGNTNEDAGDTIRVGPLAADGQGADSNANVDMRDGQQTGVGSAVPIDKAAAGDTSYSAAQNQKRKRSTALQASDEAPKNPKRKTPTRSAKKTKT